MSDPRKAELMKQSKGELAEKLLFAYNTIAKLELSIKDKELSARELIDLKIGDIVQIGEKSSEKSGLKAKQVIVLIEGHFEYDNGLYTEDQTAPAIWNEASGEFDSVYHMFGNNLEGFLDSKVIGNTAEIEKFFADAKREGFREGLEKIKKHCFAGGVDCNCVFIKDEVDCLLQSNPQYWNVDTIIQKVEAERG